MPLDRRDFLRLSGAVLAGGVAFPQVQLPPGTLIPPVTRTDAPLLEQPIPTGELGILYDTTKCIGCRACQMACKRWNVLPAEPSDAVQLPAATGGVAPVYDTPQSLSAHTWTLIQLRKLSETDWHFFNYQCMHCTDAACVTVCPTGALFKDDQGFTSYDESKCIGCGYCTQFCPYGVPHLRVDSVLSGKAKAAKCTFCQDRVLAGIGGPYCATVCPVGALVWDKRDTLLEQAKERVDFLHSQGMSQFTLYGETEAGGLHRLSIIYGEPGPYGLPTNLVSPTVSRGWQNIVQILGAVAIGGSTLAALAAFLVSRSNVHMEEVE
jgi:formate dehydrogenase iron-sulfur subunit